MDTILEICRQLNSGKTNTEIVQNIDDTEVTPSTVSKISNFKTYEDITANILKRKNVHRLERKLVASSEVKWLAPRERVKI